jgi:phage shock protein PspC (stress-responsive transcriptional regulator)
MQVNRRLYRCQHDRILAGVASGMAERFDLDPTLVRLLWVVSVFFGGFGLLLYIVMAIIVPLEPAGGPVVGLSAADPANAGASGEASGEATGPGPAGWHSKPVDHRHVARDSGRLATIVGIVLILFGSLALVDTVLPGWADHGRFLWPAFVLGLGALLVLSAMRRESTGSSESTKS